jgi:hypothetical protein
MELSEESSLQIEDSLPFKNFTREHIELINIASEGI